MKMKVGILGLAALVVMIAALPLGAAQYSAQSPMNPQTPGIGQTPGVGQAPTSHLPGNDSTEPDPLKAKQEAGQLRMQNDDRHKKLLADTEKLFALATELKAEVAKSNKDELSVTVVRKAAEMEKLAHDVKQRMTN